MKKTFLVGLDRDGTINVEVGYVGRGEDWKEKIRLCKGSLEGISLLKSKPNLKIIVASNQAGVVRGYFSCDRVVEVNNYIKEILREKGAEIDGWYYCPYVDDAYAMKKGIPLDDPWVKETDDRKPGIGMLKKAANEMGWTLEDFTNIYFIGDKKTDVETGLNAKGKGILIQNGDYPEDVIAVKELMPMYNGRIFIAKTLLDAAKIILEDTKYQT